VNPKKRGGVKSPVKITIVTNIKPKNYEPSSKDQLKYLMNTFWGGIITKEAKSLERALFLI